MSKGNYLRTRANSIFLVNILGLCLIFGLSTKKLGFTIVLYEIFF